MFGFDSIDCESNSLLVFQHICDSLNDTSCTYMYCNCQLPPSNSLVQMLMSMAMEFSLAPTPHLLPLPLLLPPPFGLPETYGILSMPWAYRLPWPLRWTNISRDTVDWRNWIGPNKIVNGQIGQLTAITHQNCQSHFITFRPTCSVWISLLKQFDGESPHNLQKAQANTS